jgi:hypothetical protein
MTSDELSIPNKNIVSHRWRPATRLLFLIQCSYFFTMALWPIVDIESVVAITGPRTDIWLVKTVASLQMAISLTMALCIFIRPDRRLTFPLGIITALAFILVDLYSVMTGVTLKIYLADAAIEFCFLMNWLATIPGSMGARR